MGLGATGAFVFCDAGLMESPLGVAVIATAGLSGVVLTVASTLPLVSTDVTGATSKMWRANRSMRAWLWPTCSAHSRSISWACARGRQLPACHPEPSVRERHCRQLYPQVLERRYASDASKSAILHHPPKGNPSWSFPTVRQAPKAIPTELHSPFFLASCVLSVIVRVRALEPHPSPPGWVHFAKIGLCVHYLFLFFFNKGPVR